MFVTHAHETGNSAVNGERWRIDHAIYLLVLLAHHLFTSPATGDDTSGFFQREDRVWTSGENIVLLIRGEVFTADGNPAGEIVVNAASKEPLDARIVGNRFELEVERKPRGYQRGVSLSISSADGTQKATQLIFDFDLRSAATRVLPIRLEPTRVIRVKVDQEGSPAVGAQLRIVGGDREIYPGKTDQRGEFQLTVPTSFSLEEITAWTDDRSIGGYQVDRGPARDPKAEVHVVELSRCRDQRIRVIDQNGRAVSQLPIKLHVGTKDHYNYVPRDGRNTFVTDANGEAVDPWFPDWPDAYCYVDLVDDDSWFKSPHRGKMEDGVFVVRVRKSKALQRKRITGQVVLPRNILGGFKLRLGTFQHPQQRRYDPIDIRCDADGAFTADVIQDATYCLCVDDASWVSEYWTGILYDAKNGKAQHPQLRLRRGERIEIEVTGGPQRKPIPGVSIYLSSKHEFSWLEDGKEKSGSLGRQWWVRTDDQGKAVTRSAPGKVKCSIYQPRWRPSHELQVQARKTTTVTFHRAALDRREVTGKVSLAPGADADLHGATVKLFAMDRVTDDQAETRLNADGEFTATIAGDHVGVFVQTKDGKAAGAVISKQPDQGINVELIPTSVVKGQLLTPDKQPLPGRWVRLVPRFEDKGANFQNATVQYVFAVGKQTTQTDSDGNFHFSGVPVGINVRITAQVHDPKDPDPEKHAIGTQIANFLMPPRSRPQTYIMTNAE